MEATARATDPKTGHVPEPYNVLDLNSSSQNLDQGLTHVDSHGRASMVDVSQVDNSLLNRTRHCLTILYFIGILECGIGYGSAGPSLILLPEQWFPGPQNISVSSNKRTDVSQLFELSKFSEAFDHTHSCGVRQSYSPVTSG